MKKILLLFTISIFLSCETKTVEIEKTAGEWLMDGNWNGKKYMLGDDKYTDLAMTFMEAYADFDPQTMVNMTTDMAKFHPGDVAGVFDVDMSNTDFIVQRQSEWDSINRNYNFIIPLKLEETNSNVVHAGISEKRFYKDGSTESILFYEKIWFNNEDKISRVVQWMRPN